MKTDSSQKNEQLVTQGELLLDENDEIADYRIFHRRNKLPGYFVNREITGLLA
jgi:hypothetical protein